MATWMIYPRQGIGSADQVRRWCAWITTGAALSGCSWGAITLLLMPRDSLLPELFLGTAIAAIAAATLSSLAYRFGPFIAFLVPALLPYGAAMALEGGHLQIMVAMATLGYAGGLFAIACNFARSSAATLKLQVENQWLLGDLAAACEKAVAAANAAEEANAEKTELCEHLDRSRREAEDANRAKSHFLATMSHELRTPLNAIIGFSDIMQHEVKGPLSGAYQEYATLIHESGLHLLNLVSDILDLAKIEAGKFSIDAREIDLMETVDLCLRLTQRRAEEGDITLVKTVEQDRLPLTADPRACKQILLNLLSNAVKFTRKGGTVEVSVAATGERVSLKVRDTGIGIPEELLPRLGGAFEQGSNDPMLAREGTGLGLALVKALVAQHGGSVSIESRENFGTVVSIDLPRAQPDRAAA